MNDANNFFFRADTCTGKYSSQGFPGVQHYSVEACDDILTHINMRYTNLVFWIIVVIGIILSSFFVGIILIVVGVIRLCGGFKPKITDSI